MAIVWTPEAEADLDTAVVYGMSRWPVEALRLTDDILDVISILEEHPRVGREGAVEGTRELIVQDYPFIVVYTVAGNVVTVLHVNHQRMQWPVGDAS